MRSSYFKFGVFAVVMILILAGLVVVFSGYRSGGTDEYHAVFTDASGIKSGQNVRISGVIVGTVTDVGIDSENRAHVTFDVGTQYPLLRSTRAAVRYENLVGDRYLQLLQAPGSTATLPPGGTIPASQTSPALDLDVLLGGFKPLFSALDPDQVNKLAASLVDVVQGQGGTLVSLLSNTSSFTKTLADRDQLIGEVITNLNTVLGTISQHRDQFSDIIANLQQVITTLAKSRTPIVDSLSSINDASGTLTSLLTDTRPDIQGDIHQLDRTMSILDTDSGKNELNWVLETLPKAYKQLVRVGSYGSFFNFYLCSLEFKLSGPGGKPIIIPFKTQTTGRCTKNP